MEFENLKNNKLWMWIIFLLHPLSAFILAIKNYKFKEYRIFILLFLLLWGYSIITIPDSDGDDFKIDYQNTQEYSFKSYSEDIQLVLDGKAINLDVYAQTIKYVSFLISPNYKVYFLLISLVYFLVLLKLMETLWEEVVDKNSRYYLSFFIGCCFIYNISAGINGIRFPLAFWVFSYGALNLILKDKIKYLLIASLSVAIHISLSFSLIFLYLFYFTKYISNRNILFLILAIALIFSYALPSLLASYMSFFGGSVESKLTGYTGEGYLESREDHVQTWNWYIQFNLIGTYYFCFFTLFLSKIKAFKLKFNEISNRLFGFSALMLIHGVLSGSVVDAISNRYNLLADLFVLIYLFYLSAQNYDNKFIKWVNYIYIPIVILNVLVKLRGDLYTLNPVLVFGNSIVVFFINVTKSIQELILG